MTRGGSARRLLRSPGPVAAAALLALGALGIALARSRVPSLPAAPGPVASSPDAGAARPPPAGPAELAILAPLGVGSELSGFLIAEIRAVNARGQLRLICRKDRAEVRLDVALAADEGPSPPATAGRYAIFYALERALPAEGEAVAAALAAVLTRNLDTPPPPRMTPFVPRSRATPL